MDAAVPFRVTSSDGSILYEGTSYIAALRTKRENAGATMTGSTA
jgi:hypothetical protein